MAEKSFPWDGATGSGGVGDCGPYSSNTWDDLYRCVFTTDQHGSEGVLANLDDELLVSGTTSPLGVAAGGAIVNGKFYRLDAATTVAVPTPTGATRIDRIVLRANYTAQTIRVVRLAGTEGAGAPPDLTQDDGVTWEISLAQVSITTAGVITITDERAFCHFGTRVSTDMLDDWAVTNDKLASAVQRMKGEIIMWSGTLSGHFPVNPDTGLANTAWHICNGDTQNGVVTPNLQNRFVIAAGSTYAAGATGGAATKNLQHTHGYGTLATDTVASHAHGINPDNIHVWRAVEPGVIDVWLSTVYHNHGGYTVGAGSHSHAVNAGATANGGSTTQDIMPPYYALVYLCYVGS